MHSGDRKQKGYNISFPNSIKDTERHCKRINFISRKNEEWNAMETSRRRQQHFTSEEKSDLATSLNFASSVYHKTAEKRRSLLIQQLVTIQLVSSVHSNIPFTYNEKVQVANKKEKENICKSIQQALKAFEHTMEAL